MKSSSYTLRSNPIHIFFSLENFTFHLSWHLQNICRRQTLPSKSSGGGNNTSHTLFFPSINETKLRFSVQFIKGLYYHIIYKEESKLSEIWQNFWTICQTFKVGSQTFNNTNKLNNATIHKNLYDLKEGVLSESRKTKKSKKIKLQKGEKVSLNNDSNWGFDWLMLGRPFLLWMMYDWNEPLPEKVEAWF